MIFARLILILAALVLLFARPGNVTLLDVVFAVVLFVLLASDLTEIQRT